MTAGTRPLDRVRSGRVSGWIARLWQGLRLRDAVLVTLLPLVAVLLLLGGAVVDYSRSLQFDDWWSNSQSVSGLFRARVHSLLRLPAALSLRHQFNPLARDPGIIRLEIPGREWDSLQGDPQQMWGSWVDGVLRYGGTAIDIRVRKRGDNSVHWLTDKRTLTIRTPREEFYKRYRSFGLSAKDVLPSWLANRLAQEFGLLVPGTEVVPVYLNNRFYGVYRFIELPDESFLRPFDRMPGNIFRADRAERGEYYKGVPRIVFENPYLWDRTAVSDRWTNAGPGQLRLLLEDLRGTTFADHQRLMARVDRDEFARLFAYLFTVGDPYHMDRVHNQLIYEDPSTQRLHPIPWDIRLLDLSQPRHTLNDWFQAVLSDPFVVDATMREIGRRLDDGSLWRVADSLARGVEQRYGPYLEYDRSRTGLVPDVGSTDEALDILGRNLELLRRWSGDARVATHAEAVAGALVLDLESRGMAGADLTGLRLGRRPGVTPALFLDRNRNGVLDPADTRVPTRVEQGAEAVRVVPLSPVPLLAGWDTQGPIVRGGPMPYRLFLTGAGAGMGVEFELSNRVTGAPAEQLAWEAGSPIATPVAWHPWMYPATPGRAHVFSGEVRLTETLLIPAQDTLIIQPGATLRLAPDVSIISRGLVLARGTGERPIRVVPLVEPRPWGTFSLLEHGADNSVLSWIEFVRGGGALVDRIEFIGMVNVHRVANVTVDHATFRENLRSDDTFHALHSTIRLSHSRFIRSNSDAIDLDISSGEIRDNLFEDTGGDALDLMTSTPRIIGNVIRRAGDKGISVGEASAPFIFDNFIEGGTRGIEVKDRSTPVIAGNEVADNKVGLRERRKNWRYGGGGWATIVSTLFRGSRVPHEGDLFSRLTLANVAGLDSVPAPAAPADLGWLYARYGVRVAPSPPGRPRAWTETSPVPPLDEARFSDDFISISDGWEPSGGATGLEKRRDALVMTVERVPGVMRRQVDWPIAGPDSALLVLELAGRDIDTVRVLAESDQGTRSLGLDLRAWDAYSNPGRDTIGYVLGGAPGPSGPSRFGFVQLRLPPGHYTSLRLEAVPRPGVSYIRRSTGLSVLRAGQLVLRGYAVYPGASGHQVAAGAQ